MRLSNLLLAGFFLLVLTISCGSKKPVLDRNFFPAISIIKGQINKMDSTLSTIRQYNFIDSTHTDTSYIPREQFRAAASEFLKLPDVTRIEFQDRYNETSQLDETLNRLILTCTPIKPEKEQLQRQEVLVKPEGSNNVTNIIFNIVFNSKDSSVQKYLLWKVDESFQVTTTRQLAGKPETTTTYKVEWGDQ